MSLVENIFSERLKEVRLQKGLTQEQLGAFADIGKSAINNLEKGIKLPSYPVLLGLADGLNVSLDFLVGRSDDPKVRRPHKPDQK